MTTRSIVLVDMDGVLADFDSQILKRLAERHTEVAIPAKRTHFYIAQDFPGHKALVRALSDEEGFFAALQVVESALQGWQRIIDLGHHPRVCTSPIRSNPFCEAEKRAWLARHLVPEFGERVVEEAVVTSDKHMVPGVALIDDRPEIVNGHVAQWQHIIFDRPYNQHVDGPRLFGWRDLRLSHLLAQAIDAR